MRRDSGHPSLGEDIWRVQCGAPRPALWADRRATLQPYLDEIVDFTVGVMTLGSC